MYLKPVSVGPRTIVATGRSGSLLGSGYRPLLLTFLEGAGTVPNGGVCLGSRRSEAFATVSIWLGYLSAKASYLELT